MTRTIDARNALSATRAAQTILDGGVVVYPTETIYGLGANALEPEIVEKVYRIKERQKSNPILVLVPDRQSLEELVIGIPDVAETLMERFWPGPLTIVFNASPIVSPILTAGSGKLGIRLSSDSFCRDVLGICRIPITSTSANLSGEPNPDTIGVISTKVLDSVDLIVDAGKLTSRTPSTVVDVTNGKVELLREGVVEFGRIQQLIQRRS